MYEYLDRRYALALYQVAESKGKVEEYLEQLKEIVDLFKNNKDLNQVVNHPEITTTRTKKVFVDLFRGKIDEELLGFLLLLVDKGRIAFLDKKLKEMEKIHLERNNIVIAEVRTVVPLLEEEKAALTKNLERRYNKKIVLKEKLDSTIIGGVYLRVGDDIIDGTVKRKLKDMKKVALDRIEVR